MTAAVTYRVLIVDDEDSNWARPMRDALVRAARIAQLEVAVEIANFSDHARSAIAREHFHLVSLDMRLPERANELVSIDTGLKLAAEFPAIGYPKYLIYSQTLNTAPQTGSWDESGPVRELQADAYAKPSGASRPYQHGVPTLSAREWGQRVVAYFDRDRLHPDPDPGDSAGRLTLLGAHFKRGPALLPPPLARGLLVLANGWAPGAVDAGAVRALAHDTVRWGLAQSEVLMAAGGGLPPAPADPGIRAALAAWRRLLPELAAWNWSRYCHGAALDALDAILGAPEMAGGAMADVLTHCLDIASYWARHPVCAELRHSRDGWTALPLRGTALPRRRQLLPAAQDYGAARDSTGPWQSVWLLDGPGGLPRPRAVDWTAVLQRDSGSDGGNTGGADSGDNSVGSSGSDRWWLRLHAGGQGSTGCSWLDIDSGDPAER